MDFPEYSPDHCPDCGEELLSEHRDGRGRLYCRNCGQIVWLNPDIAAGFIVQKEDEFLFQKRKIDPHSGKWSIPAGYLEIDEAPIEAAERELEEETGLEVTGETSFVGHVQLRHPDERRVIVAVFHVDFEDVEGELSPEEEEVEKLEFWKFEEILSRRDELDYTDYLELIGELREDLS
ncbi:MAG: NUDIX domain-containing protein [Candidatus Nanohalobium sp.]